jgi:hypothetical protein
VKLPKPATIISIVALFISLTSGAYATRQALIGSPQIKDGSIQLVDISAKAKKALKGQRGPRGFRGANGAGGTNGLPGPQGAQGPQGAPGRDGGFDLSKVYRKGGPAIGIAPGSTASFEARCNPGDVAIEGEWVADNNIGGKVVSAYLIGDGFHMEVKNEEPAHITVFVFVTCAKP